MNVGETRKLVGQYWELTDGVAYLHQKYELMGPWDGGRYCYEVSAIQGDKTMYCEKRWADSPEAAVEKMHSVYEGFDLKILSVTLIEAENEAV